MVYGKEVEDHRSCLGTLVGWMVVIVLSCAVPLNFYSIMQYTYEAAFSYFCLQVNISHQSAAPSMQ